jgi:hypothetical protein
MQKKIIFLKSCEKISLGLDFGDQFSQFLDHCSHLSATYCWVVVLLGLNLIEAVTSPDAR